MIHKEWRYKKQTFFGRTNTRLAIGALGLVVATVIVDRAVIAITTPAPRAVEKAVLAAPDTPSEASSFRAYKVIAGRWAAQDEATLDKLQAFQMDNDQAGIATLAQNGQIVAMKGNQKVYWVGSSGYLGSKVHVRMADTQKTVWITRDSLQ